MDTAYWVILGATALLLFAGAPTIVVMRFMRTLREATSQAMVRADEGSRTRRSLPVLTDCRACEHFDLEAGQARMRRNPVFLHMVAPYIAPSEYGEEVDPESETKHKPEVPPNCDWSQFGHCLKNNEGVWARTTREQRLANFPDWTAEGDCYEPRVLMEIG